MEKQTIYISKNNLSKELSKQLYKIKNRMQIEETCLEFEIFLCDENENEFLVYEKWSDKNSQKFVLNDNEELFIDLKKLIYRKEVLPII